MFINIVTLPFQQVMVMVIYLLDLFDAPATQRQSTSDNEYSGNVSSGINDRGGYLSNEYDAPAPFKDKNR